MPIHGVAYFLMGGDAKLGLVRPASIPNEELTSVVGNGKRIGIERVEAQTAAFIVILERMGLFLLAQIPHFDTGVLTPAC